MFKKEKYSEELSRLINKNIKLGNLLRIAFIQSNDSETNDKIEIDILNSTITFNFNYKETKYEINKINILHLKKIIKKYNLPAWANLPMGDLLALDAPTKMIVLYYDNSKVGGAHLESYPINFYSRIPEDGFNYLNKFLDYILSLKKEG